MPQLTITQSEQQILASILKKELSQLNDTQTDLKAWTKDIYELGLPSVARRGAQRALHNQISRNKEKMKKRIELLKVVKQPYNRSFDLDFSFDDLHEDDCK